MPPDALIALAATAARVLKVVERPRSVAGRGLARVRAQRTDRARTGPSTATRCSVALLLCPGKPSSSITLALANEN